MPTFNDNSVHRVVSRDGKEYVLFSRHNNLFLDAFDKGTMLKAKLKQATMWTFRHLGAIVSSLGLLATVLVLFNHKSFENSWTVTTFIVIGFFSFVVGMSEISQRANFGFTVVDDLRGKRINTALVEYLESKISANYRFNELFIKHMMEASENDFIKVAEKFVLWNSFVEARDELRKEISGYANSSDKEFVDYADLKLSEINEKIKEHKAEEASLFSKIENEAKQSSLIKSVVNVEEKLAA